MPRSRRPAARRVPGRAPAAGPVRARHDRRAGRRGGSPRREPPASARGTARGRRRPPALFESLDPSRTAAAVASAASGPARGRGGGGLLWPDGDGFVLAGGAGLPDGATAPSVSPTLEAVAETREPFVPAADAPADPELARCLGATPRAVLPLSVDEWLVAAPRGRQRAALRDRAVAALHARRRRRAPERASPRRVAIAPRRGAGRRAHRHRSWAPTRGAAPLGDMASLLAVVLGRLAAVRDRVGDPEAARDLVHAEEAAWRVAEGVRRVLGFAPRSGAHAGRPRSTSARRSATRCARRSGSGPPRAACRPSRSISSRCRRCACTPTSSGMPCTISSRTRARPGTSAGPVAIWLRWNGATHVELSVADRGRGMDEATRARADEPFFTTKGPGRLGVGLAVVRAMASRHRGELEIESAPGQGTTVRLRLPTAAGPRAGAVRPDARAPAPAPDARWSTTTRPCGRRLVQGLEREGYSCEPRATWARRSRCWAASRSISW